MLVQKNLVLSEFTHLHKLAPGLLDYELSPISRSLDSSTFGKTFSTLKHSMSFPWKRHCSRERKHIMT